LGTLDSSFIGAGDTPDVAHKINWVCKIDYSIFKIN
jgi:hypothetical protein